MPADSDLADLLKKNPNEYALALGHIFDLTPRALGLFRERRWQCFRSRYSQVLC